MNEFKRLDKLSENLLKLIQERPITLSEISFIFQLPTNNFSAQLVELFTIGYVVYERIGLKFSVGVLLNEKIQITQKGIGYLENVSRQEKEEKMSFKLRLIPIIVGIAALIVSILILLQTTGWIHLEKL